MTKTKITNRDKAKARTRARLLAKSREMFATQDYHAVTIRNIAKSMRMTTGVIFAHFPGKAELFEAAMGFPPPVDGPLTRAAPMLLEAVSALLDKGDHAAAFAFRAVELATSPLDGEAWARHLSAIRRDEPHLATDGQPAASNTLPDAAGDQ